MAAQKLIVVIGATGMQGGSVVDTFVADPAWKVRGVTRDPSSEKAQALKAKGVEVVAGEMDDVESLKRAFAGASAIFGVTDFFAAMGPALGEKEIPSNVTPYVWGAQHEAQQGKNTIDAAATVQGLERFVFSSLTSPNKVSKGKLSKGLHFESKAEVADHCRDNHPELWAKTSIFQAGVYLSNLTQFPFMKPVKAADGSYRFITQIKGDALLPWIAAEEDTGPLTKALVEAPAGKNLAGYRELITGNDFVAIWKKLLGVQAEWKTIPSSEAIPELPEIMSESFGQICQFINEYGYDGGDKSVAHPSQVLNDKSLGSVETWIQSHDWSSVL